MQIKMTVVIELIGLIKQRIYDKSLSTSICQMY